MVMLQGLAALSLVKRRRMPFCWFVAILTCLSIPLGTALGMFTIVAPRRPSMKALFRR